MCCIGGSGIVTTSVAAHTSQHATLTNGLVHDSKIRCASVCHTMLLSVHGPTATVAGSWYRPTAGGGGDASGEGSSPQAAYAHRGLMPMRNHCCHILTLIFDSMRLPFGVDRSCARKGRMASTTAECSAPCTQNSSGSSCCRPTSKRRLPATCALTPPDGPDLMHAPRDSPRCC